MAEDYDAYIGDGYTVNADAVNLEGIREALEAIKKTNGQMETGALAISFIVLIIVELTDLQRRKRENAVLRSNGISAFLCAGTMLKGQGILVNVIGVFFCHKAVFILIAVFVLWMVDVCSVLRLNLERVLRKE